MPVRLDYDPDGKRPLVPIIYAEIVTMVGNYRNAVTGTDGIKSCWVSANELMALISQNKASGVRIYYGRHPEDGKPYAGKHNVILVSTYDNVTPQDPTTENSIDLLNYTPQTGPVNTVSYSGEGGDAIPLCPPRCPTSSHL